MNIETLVEKAVMLVESGYSIRQAVEQIKKEYEMRESK